jgi:hypothetical protein
MFRHQKVAVFFVTRERIWKANYVSFLEKGGSEETSHLAFYVRVGPRYRSRRLRFRNLKWFCLKLYSSNYDL